MCKEYITHLSDPHTSNTWYASINAWFVIWCDMITKSSDDIWGEHAIGRKAKALFITRRAPPHLIGKPIDRSGLAPPIWQLTGNPFIRTPFLGQPPLHSRITSQCFQGKVVAQSTVKSSLALSHRQKPQNISHFQFIISVILEKSANLTVFIKK